MFLRKLSGIVSPLNRKVGCSIHGHLVNRPSVPWGRAFTTIVPHKGNFRLRPAVNKTFIKISETNYNMCKNTGKEEFFIDKGQLYSCHDQNETYFNASFGLLTKFSTVKTFCF